MYKTPTEESVPFSGLDSRIRKIIIHVVVTNNSYLSYRCD